MSDHVFRYHLDTVGGFLTVQTRPLSRNGKYLKPRGEIVRYDLATGRRLWARPLHYGTQTVADVPGATLFFDGDHTSLLAPDTGEPVWAVEHTHLVYASASAGVALGYRHRPGRASPTERYGTLRGIDLRDGRVRWERPITRAYGWDDVVMLDAHTALIVAAGVHRVDLRTGEGWDFTTATATRKYDRAIVTAVGGIALGALTGVYVVGDVSPDLVRGAVSNLLIEGGGVYFAGLEEIVRLDLETGAPTWRTPLPKGDVSASVIAAGEDELFFLNRGFAYRNGRSIRFGRPFVAAFAKTDGRQRYLEHTAAKGNPVLGWAVDGTRADLAFAQMVKRVDLAEGTVGGRYNRPGDQPLLAGLLGDDAYVLSADGASVVPAAERFGSVRLLRDEASDVLALDATMAPLAELPGDGVYAALEASGAYRVLANDGRQVVTDPTGRLLGTIGFEAPGQMYGSRYYIGDEDRIIVVDLADFDAAGVSGRD